MAGPAQSRRFRLILCVDHRFINCLGLANAYQVEENQNTGKISLGLSVIMRVTLRDGTFHEVKGSLRDMDFGDLLY